MRQNNFYITTPIYYPSGEPHIGHAYSSILADVFARFYRNDNCNVYFLTGTDEHGLKIQKAAEKDGSDPLIYCNKISKIFKDLTKTLNLSNDDFIRTTEKRHHESVNDLSIKNNKNLGLYFVNKSKLLKQIDHAKKFNLDKKNLLITIKGTLEHETK